MLQTPAWFLVLRKFLNSPNASICQHDLDATWVRVAVREDGLYDSSGQNSRRLVFLQNNVDLHTRLDIGADAAGRDRFPNMLTDCSGILRFFLDESRISPFRISHTPLSQKWEYAITPSFRISALAVLGIQQPHSSQYRVYGPPLFGWTFDM